MTEEYRILKLREQLSVLRDVQVHYSGRNIDNIIQNMESILSYHIKKQKQNDIKGIPETGNGDMPPRE